MNVSGELAAIGGYYTQYDIAAWEIYSNLVNEKLEWIHLAAKEVGNLDDVLIGLKDRVLACQVKDRAGSFTYSSLISSHDDLLKKMFSGWKSLKRNYPDKKIDVRLLNTQTLSENDLIQSYAGDKKPNFKVFLFNYWIKIKQNNGISELWNGVTEELITVLSCTKYELFEFIKDTTFSFNYALPEANNYNIIKWNRMSEDTALIRHFIFDTVGKEKKPLLLNINEFLYKTGLKGRLQTYFQHDFFIDEKHYQPIQKSIGKLSDLIEKYKSGYVAILGSAGSGKSTLLTKWLQQSNQRVLKYFSYINRDMTYDSGFRGESKYFLHDILTQVRRLRADFAETIPGGDRIDLATELRQELSRFSRDYSHDGIKTIIIVDGLDHIQREQNVEYSLIKDLPAPESIPDGVYFVLGSRTIDGLTDLANNIKFNIQKEQRAIDIAPLVRHEALNVVKSYDLLFSEKQLENISLNTEGHPLFLRYTIERLLSVHEEEYDDIIENQKFTGNIFDEYQKFWLSIEAEEDLKQLLSIISRFRFSFIDLELLESSFGFTNTTLTKFLYATRHFFYVPEKTKWQYFHNSFKWFLEEWTAKMPLTEKFNSAKDEEIHSTIAVSIESSNSHYRWNRIYHLFKAKQFGKIISAATQDYFREQWYQFRNHKFISEDISVAAQAAYYEHNPVAWFRYLLCLSELGQRLIDFDPSDYFDIYLNLDLQDVADSYMFNGRELLVSKEKALTYAYELFQKGKKEHARKLFELAEPTHILYYSKEVDKNIYNPDLFSQTDETVLIKKWASVAVFFQSLSDVFSLIKSLEVKDSHNHHSDEKQKFSERLKSELLAETYTTIAEIFIEAKDWQKAAECLDNIQNDIGKGWTLLNIISSIFFNVSESEHVLTNYCTQVINNWSYSEYSEINLQLCVLYAYALKDCTKAKAYFDKLPLPHWNSEEDMYRKSVFNYLFDYTRLYYILTKDFETSSESFLPDTKDSDVLVADRQVCAIARFYALAYHGEKEALNDILVQLFNILQFYHKHFLDLDYKIRERKSDLLDLIVNVSRRSSPELYQKVINLIARDWAEFFTYWKVNEIRDIIIDIADDEKYLDWAAEQLNFLEDKMLERKRVGDRSEQCIKQARSWIKLGKLELAEKNLKQAFHQTFGIRGEKDYQLDHLIEWLPKINSLQPNLIQNRLSWYLKRVGYIQDTTSHAHQFASLEILQICLEWNAGNGFELFKWLLFNRLISFPEALEKILDFLLKTDQTNTLLYAKIFTRTLLFYQDNGDYGHQISSQIVSGLKEPHLIKDFVKEIEIYGIEQKRNGVIKQIIEACESRNIDIGMNKDDYPVEDLYTSNETYKSLRLTTGEILSQNDAISKIKTVDQMFEFISLESESSHFDWSDVANNLKAQLTEEKLRMLIRSKEFDSIKLSKIGTVAFDTGYVKLAKEIGYEALNKSRDAGWLAHYDGGSKLESYRLLMKVDTDKKVSDLAFKDLAFSLRNTDYKRLVENIFPILEIICPDADFIKLFEEVNGYIAELLKNATLSESNFAFDEQPIDTPDFVAELMTFLYEFPVPNMREQLETIAIESYWGSKIIIDCFLEKLYEKKYHEGYLTILYGTSHFIQDIEEAQIDRLNQLLHDDQIDKLYLSHQLLNDFGNSPELKYKRINLPLVYRMELNKRPELIVDEESRLKEIERRRSLRETNDPLEYIMFYKSDVEILSKHSGIPAVNIAYRMMQIAEQEALPEWYNKLSEQEIAGFFKSVELNMPYIRPRMLRLWPALMKVLSELWKSNSIPLSLGVYVCKKIDPWLHSLNIHSRPLEMQSLTDKEDDIFRRKRPNEEWVNQMDDSCFARFLKETNDKIVIAEFSKLKSLDDGRGTEIRQSFISPNQKSNHNRYHFFEGMIYNRNIQEYLVLESDEVILFNYCQTFDTRKMWLAINPGICVEADWTLSDEGNFRWIDSSGNIMVESVYWIDGNCQNYERLLYSETGYGWFVVASRKALETIKSKVVKDLFFHQKCSRKYKLYQQRHNVDIDVNNDLFKSGKWNN